MNRSKIRDPRFWTRWRAAGACTIVPGKPDYSSTEVPAHYVCSDCGATGCKLWREYQSLSLRLECCDCAGKSQGKDVSGIGTDGRLPLGKSPSMLRTDAIGWRVPAVPTAEDGNSYWGYASVPLDGEKWWSKLPTRPVHATA